MSGTEKAKRGDVRLGWDVAREREPGLSYAAFTRRVRVKRLDALRDMLEAKKRALRRQTRELKCLLDDARRAQRQFD
jgi:hypothetical protein